MEGLRRPRPPCVVVGNEINGLGVARSLTADGIRVIAAAASAGPAWWSAGVTRARLRAMSGAPLVEDLLALAARLGGERPVLLLTDEQAVLAVSSSRHRLAGAYRFLLPDHAAVLELAEKSSFQARAGALGYPVTAAVTLRGPADLPGLDRLRFPCVVKPSRRTPAYERRFAKAYVAQAPADARQFVLAMLAVAPEIIVQEWIEGEDGDIHFCLLHMTAEGCAGTAFVGRKLRIYPPRIGYTASCTVAEPDAQAELAPLTERFFAELGYRGLGSMEYKRDRRTGRFLMIEPTVGRTDWQEEVATLNGVNLPVTAYRHLVGEQPLPAATAGRRTIWRNSLDHLASGLRDDRPASPLPRGSAVSDALWRVGDPLPALLGYPMLVAKTLSRLLSRVVKVANSLPRPSPATGK